MAAGDEETIRGELVNERGTNSRHGAGMGMGTVAVGVGGGGVGVATSSSWSKYWKSAGSRWPERSWALRPAKAPVKHHPRQ